MFNRVDNRGRTPTLLAAKGGHADVLRELIRAGRDAAGGAAAGPEANPVDLARPDDKGQSAAFVACAGGRGAANQLCAKGYMEALCSRCSPSYFRDVMTNECASCDSSASLVVPIVFFSILVVLALHAGLLADKRRAEPKKQSLWAQQQPGWVKQHCLLFPQWADLFER